MESERLRRIGDAVMIRHTLFSLPFALAAILLETGGRPPLMKMVWILLAAVGARNAANALNRIIDSDIDARNPRTAGRHLPSGRLAPRDLWIFAAAMIALVLVATAMLNWLCVALLPVAGVLVVGYSFSKRFTWLCHYWLGLACQCATMGAFLGISGRFEFRYFVFCAAVVLWVAGFDIIYAFQDVEVDRKQGIKSLPASLGRLLAWLAAAGSHALVVVFLAGAALFWPLGPAYLAGIGLAALLLAAEHLILLLEPSFGVAAKAGGEDPGEGHLKVAAYRINEILPFVVLAGLAVDLYLL